MFAFAVLAALLLLPFLEIYVIIQVAERIGGWNTAGLLLVGVLLGAWIIRRAGRRAWRALNEAVRTGVMPDHEIADAGLVLVGGVLLFTPGFITDVIGFLFVLPFTRPLVRRLLALYAARRAKVAERRASLRVPAGVFGDPSVGGPREGGPQDTPHGGVIRGEVIREDEQSGD